MDITDNDLLAFEKEYGSIDFEGKKYILVEEAYSNDCLSDRDIIGQTYRAFSVRQDKPNIKATVYWAVIEYDENYELDDESNACDWDNPIKVIED